MGLEFLDLKDGKLTRRYVVGGIPWILAFSPDGKSCAAFWEGRLQLLNPSDGRVTRGWPAFGGVAAVAYHPDGRHLIVVNFNRTIYILRLAPAPSPAKTP